MAIFIKFMTIFCARVLDVSLGSLRIIFIGKGKPKVAFLMAFIEVCIWFMVAKDVLSGGEWWYMFPYALGYATGTFLGIKINEKFVTGNLGVQIVTSTKNEELIEILKNRGYAMSIVDVKGSFNRTEKYMLFLEINKLKYENLIKIVNEHDPQAFVTVNDTRYVVNGFIK